MPGDAPRGEKPHLTLRLARATLDAVVGRTTTFPDAVAAGLMVPDGDLTALTTLGGLMERPDPRFPIVTP
ncbi:alkyl sulfatase C-terminal domain-containing protein, partial [Streptomyces mutabilis]